MNPLLAHEQSLIRSNLLPLFGGFAQQNPQILVSLNRLLNAHKFDTIIELGSHVFGLSLPLALYCALSRIPASCGNLLEPTLCVNQTHHKSPKRFHTFDYVVRDNNAAQLVRYLGGDFRQLDTLNSQTNIDMIRGLIRDGGSVLLLCDGGNKKRELELYGEALKSGDFVMLHDWAADEVSFERNKDEGVWYSWEVRWRDGEGEGQQFGIKDLCEKYGVEQVYAEEFNRAAWFCGRKT